MRILGPVRSRLRKKNKGAGFGLRAAHSSSFLRIGRSGKTWMDRHYESWTRDAKVFIGRLWYPIAGDSRETDYGSGNAVIGIRG